jgi:hypothetical protein
LNESSTASDNNASFVSIVIRPHIHILFEADPI